MELQGLNGIGLALTQGSSRGSFKTADRLARVEAAVERRLAALKAEVRAQKARAALEKMRAEKERRRKTHPQDESKKSEPSASLSDPEVRCMRFPDGAIRPAYSAQIAVGPRQGIIVSVAMTDRRNDAGWRHLWLTILRAAMARRHNISWSTRIKPPAPISQAWRGVRSTLSKCLPHRRP